MRCCWRRGAPPRRGPPARIRRSIGEPGTVDYARSFFPVALVVLLLRSFVFEPFRIPSDSMMPTLLDGDFIIVNKYAYGLRLPVINRKVVAVGEPQRGDVVVFRYPPILRSTSSSAWWACRAIMSRCTTISSSSTASRCRSTSASSATTTAAT